MNDPFPRTKRRLKHSRDAVLIIGVPAAIILLVVAIAERYGLLP